MSTQTIANKSSLVQQLKNEPGSTRVIKAFNIATFILDPSVGCVFKGRKKGG